jgi:phosphoglycerate kinase
MIQYIDQVEITNKRVLLRVDFNVSLNADGSIKNDERIKRAVPTIKNLLDAGNKLILVSHLGQPKGYDAAFTTERLATRLQELVSQPVLFIPFDKTFDPGSYTPTRLQACRLFMLDNIRFHPGEKKNDPEFAKQLASLADVYVDDAFGVCHRSDASVVGVPALLPHYGGLLLKQEVEMIRKAINNPTHPVVAIIAGSKVSTKIGLIEKLMSIADQVLIGGAMTNNFLKVQGYETGKGLFEPEYVEEARRLLELDKVSSKIKLPVDRRIGSQTDETSELVVKKVSEVGVDDETLDIGPETEKEYSDIISQAKTIIWNGPVGYFENPQFAKGSLAIYNAITSNSSALSVVGGGDTLTVIKKLLNQEKITHISTGGGAMLELVEKGTLPGIEALEK